MGRHAAAVTRNFDFFGAPLAGIACMQTRPWPGRRRERWHVFVDFDAGSDRPRAGRCVEVSVVGYPDVVRAELNIPPELAIICGLAVGCSVLRPRRATVLLPRPPEGAIIGAEEMSAK